VSRPSQRQTFGEVYREQHREVTSSRTSKVFRVLTPLLFLAVAIGLITISSVGAVVIAVVGVALLVAAILLGRRERGTSGR
jgi:Flp pilus assembly protein TadB